jgi:hypothetical protein
MSGHTPVLWLNFKSHFKFQDPTPVVRIKSSTLLPYLKSQLKMPSDRPLLQQLEASSRRSLMSERNKDVLSHIQRVCDIYYLV